MSIRSALSYSLATIGLTLLISVPLGRLTFSELTADLAFELTSFFHIYGDEAVGDFLVDLVLCSSLLLSALAVYAVHRVIKKQTKRNASHVQ